MLFLYQGQLTFISGRCISGDTMSIMLDIHPLVMENQLLRQGSLRKEISWEGIILARDYSKALKDQVLSFAEKLSVEVLKSKPMLS